MDWRRKARFLSVRSVYVGLGLGLAALTGAAGMVIGAVIGRPAFGALALCLILLVASALVSWFWIALPYYRFERAIRAFWRSTPQTAHQEERPPSLRALSGYWSRPGR